MQNGINEIWSGFFSTIRGVDSNRQLALGITLGLMAGLIPKVSLLPYLIAVVLILSTANLLTGILGALLGSVISPLLDPLTHKIGSVFLTFDVFEPTFAWLNSLPLVPWTRFENTVVSGSLILGLILAYPAYRFSKTFFERYGARFYSSFTNSWIGKWLLGAPTQEVEGA